MVWLGAKGQLIERAVLWGCPDGARRVGDQREGLGDQRDVPVRAPFGLSIVVKLEVGARQGRGRVLRLASWKRPSNGLLRLIGTALDADKDHAGRARAVGGDRESTAEQPPRGLYPLILGRPARICRASASRAGGSPCAGRPVAGRNRVGERRKRSRTDLVFESARGRFLRLSRYPASALIPNPGRRARPANAGFAVSAGLLFC